MNKKAGHDNQVGQSGGMHLVTEASDSSFLIAGVMRGCTRKDCDEFCNSHPSDSWHIFPLPLESGCRFADWPDGIPNGTYQIYTAMFSVQLKRELKRLSRNGGSLSLLCAALARKKGLETALGEGTVLRLESLLCDAMRGMMDDCDSIGPEAGGRYIALLPGIGQLRSRSYAHRVQDAFAELARPFSPNGGISAGFAFDCAIGIVNLVQGETGKPDDLLDRVNSALDKALKQEEGHIFQESANAPREGGTLVHSNEKRFLFFGGEPQ